MGRFDCYIPNNLYKNSILKPLLPMAPLNYFFSPFIFFFWPILFSLLFISTIFLVQLFGNTRSAWPYAGKNNFCWKSLKKPQKYTLILEMMRSIQSNDFLKVSIHKLRKWFLGILSILCIKIELCDGILEKMVPNHSQELGRCQEKGNWIEKKAKWRG